MCSIEVQYTIETSEMASNKVLVWERGLGRLATKRKTGVLVFMTGHGRVEKVLFPIVLVMGSMSVQIIHLFFLFHFSGKVGWISSSPYLIFLPTFLDY